ncbi:MAG: menaquinone biosynthetic enzyme MqnA/MqnD family protein [Gemmatimonadales bacterium]
MRLGRIGYINCYPVYGAIDRGIVSVDADLVTGTPSELNGLLAAGELDVSVVSAVEYARNAGAYQLLPDLAISCDGPVQSVALFSHCDARELDGATVLTSASSRTSIHLLELLCSDVWNVTPKFVAVRTEAGDIDALAELPHEAVLVIGDAALLLAARGIYAHRYDLGQMWKEWTGLPFVFAVWAARREGRGPNYLDRVRQVHGGLIASREWGLTNVDVLAQAAGEKTGLGFAECREYLSGLDYALSHRHLEGLTGFFRRLAARGTVPEGTLSFLSVA